MVRVSWSATEGHLLGQLKIGFSTWGIRCDSHENAFEGVGTLSFPRLNVNLRFDSVLSLG
jgi:hypothetical protein